MSGIPSHYLNSGSRDCTVALLCRFRALFCRSRVGSGFQLVFVVDAGVGAAGAAGVLLALDVLAESAFFSVADSVFLSAEVESPLEDPLDELPLEA